MPKKILVVSDVFLIGGLETHIRVYSEQLIREGVKTYLVTGKNFENTLLPSGLSGFYPELLLHPEMTFVDLELNVEFLRKIIRKNSITHIHAHPFLGIMPAFIAARKENISISLMLHGPISVYGYYPVFFDYILRSLIFPEVDNIYVVSEEVKNLVLPYCSEDKIIVQYNAVNIDPIRQGILASKHWLVCSRLDQEKVKGIKVFLEYVATSDYIDKVDILGGGDAEESLRTFINENGLASIVTFLGVTDDVTYVMQSYAGVVGMGRVVLEALSLGIPAIQIGYDGVKGLVQPDNFHQRLSFNLSGRCIGNIERDILDDSLKNITWESQQLLIKLLKKYCNVVDQIDLFLMKTDCVDINKKNLFVEAFNVYGYVFQANKKEPFLLSQSFFNILGDLLVGKNENQSENLAIYNYYFQRIKNNRTTFTSELERDKAALVTVVSELERDKEALVTVVSELERDKEALVAVISDLEKAKEKLAQIELSTSWRMTLPLRFVGDFMKNTKKISFNLLRAIYRSLPEGLKRRLSKQKVKYLDKIKVASSERGVQKLLKCDLSWDEFQIEVLSNRDKYQGVFIQQEIIDWNVPLYQRPQHIATAFGKLGYLVIYKTYDMSGNDNINGFREIEKNVWITNSQEVNTIEGAVSSIYSTAYAAQSFIELLNNKNKQIVVYEYIDHIDEEISGDAENIKRLNELKDAAFSGKADYIVASAKNLYEEAVEAVGKDRVVFVQNGVDTEHYRNPIHINTPINEKLVEFRGKYKIVIGYFGALAPWLWYDLIRDITKKRSDIGFVYIGPDYYGGVDKLVKAENLLYLGPIDYKVLPAYARQFDVCFIPFKPGDIAQSTSPLKLFEYFALEKPVIVTSDMRECVVYPEVFHGANVEEINSAIDAAIAIKDDKEYKQKLAKLADENSWIERAKAMAEVYK